MLSAYEREYEKPGNLTMDAGCPFSFSFPKVLRVGFAKDDIASSGVNYSGLVNMHIYRGFAFPPHSDRDQS